MGRNSSTSSSSSSSSSVMTLRSVADLFFFGSKTPPRPVVEFAEIVDCVTAPDLTGVVVSVVLVLLTAVGAYRCRMEADGVKEAADILVKGGSFSLLLSCLHGCGSTRMAVGAFRRLL